MTSDPPVPAHPVHPWIFLVLFAPYGISTGYVNVTLGYALTHAGVSTADVATIVAISLIPQTWKVLWAPIIDTMLSRKRWYMIAAVTTGLGMAATGFVTAGQASLTIYYALVLGFNLTISFLTMSVESLMAHCTLPEQRGRAGGWLQAGNLGGLGLGGGAGLWIVQHVAGGGDWLPALVLGGSCIACSLALPLIAEPAADPGAEGLAENLLRVLKDVWSVARSRPGCLAMIILFMPIGTGAAANLWADVAGDWGASANVVALVSGLLSGLISAFGCIVGGYLCDLMDRKTSYSAFGVALALCAIGMALAPRTPTMFVVFSSLYNFMTGLTYASFTALTLEAIDRGAAATKYNLLACLSNVPIAYMTQLDGSVQTRWGSGAMLYVEAALGFAGIAVFFAIALGTRQIWPRWGAPVAAA